MGIVFASGFDIFMATIRLLGRLRGRIPKFIWSGLAAIAGACAALNLALVLAWLFLGPSNLPPPPSHRAAAIVGNIGEVLRDKAAATPQLKKDIRSPDVDVRRRAAILLGIMDVAADDVVPELRKALSDERRISSVPRGFPLAHLGERPRRPFPTCERP